MILTLTMLLLCSLMAHYCISDGRLVWANGGSLWRVDRSFDAALVVTPIFVVGAVLVGLRPLDAGYDTPHYVEAWLALEGVSSARDVGVQVYGNTEILWWPVQSLFRGFLNPADWLMLNYLLVFAAVFWLYRVLCGLYAVNPLIFALVFLTYFFVYSGNAIRQALSLPLGALAFCWWFDRRYFRSLLTVLLAIGLHWASLVFVLTPLLSLPILRRQSVLLLLPSVALLCAFLIDDVARIVVYSLGMPELIEKYVLYFEGGRASHVGAVWKTFNFWLCAGVSTLFLMICKPSVYGSLVLHRYVMFFLSLVLFGVTVSDVSERFFPALLLVLPLMLVLILRRFQVPDSLAEALLVFGFLALWLLICSTESAQTTLGFEFY